MTFSATRIAWFIGEVARPFAIMWTAFCAGIAVVVLALKLTDPVQFAVFIGAVLATGLTPIFLGKAAEESSKAKSAARAASPDTPSPEKE